MIGFCLFTAMLKVKYSNFYLKKHLLGQQLVPSIEYDYDFEPPAVQ